MLTLEDRVLAGVSGGADSTALLLALHKLGYKVAVAHLNHALRGTESDQDEEFVRDLATRLAVPFFARTEVTADSRGNLEAVGRQARRKFFESLVQDNGFTKIALAHNREDRVETFLLHLMRGAGSEGLVSMAPIFGRAVRPLIESSRTEIEGFLTELGQSWRTDRTNLDMSFSRNRMRLEVLPRLASLFNARLPETLTRTITLLEEEDQWMNTIAEAWLKEHDAGGLDVTELCELPAALLRRLIRLKLRRAGSDLTDLTFDHIEAIRDLLTEGKSGKSVQLPKGLVARREFHRLEFVEAQAVVPDFAYELSIPGMLRVPELGRVFSATCVSDSVASQPSPDGSTRVLVDGDQLGSYVKIRNWKPGDYYKPAGWPSGKVKKLFQRARVPRSQRGRWPLFATDSVIIWVTSFPVSRDFIPSAHSKKIVAFEALEG